MMNRKEIAEWIEKIFFPSNTIILASIILLLYFRNDPSFANSFIIFMLTLFPSYASIYVLKRYVTDVTILYLIGTVIASFSFLLSITFLTPFNELIYFAYSLFSTMLSFSLIRLRWKISGHVTVATFISTALTLVYWNLLIFYTICPIIAWSRLELKAHSVSQVVIGSLLGLIIPVILFNLSPM